MNDLPVQYLQNHKSGMQALRLTEEPYKGIMFTFGKVSFNERDDGHMACNFEYNIIDDCDREIDMAEFEKYISKILEELIRQGIKENSLTYTGGVDENRTKDLN
jgi:hypothetical protein